MTIQDVAIKAHIFLHLTFIGFYCPYCSGFCILY